MPRFLHAFLLLCLAGWASAQARPPSGEANADKTARVLVTIASASRAPSKEDVSALVDGRPAQVTEIVPAKDQQLIFVVLMDVSGSSRDKEAFEKKYSVELFRALKTPNNIGFFGDFNDELYLGNKPATIESINAEFKNIGLFRGGSAPYDAVFRATQLAAKAPGQQNARRAVFVLTDGNDNASSQNLKNTINEAQRQGIAVFCIGLSAAKKSADGLQTLSSETGGSAVFLTAPDNFLPKLLRVLQDQFWITLALPGAPDKKLHSLALTSSDSHARIWPLLKLRHIKPLPRG